MLKMIEYLISEQRFDFNQEDINFFRQKYSIELYNRELSI